jgi:uncharacterized protein
MGRGSCQAPPGTIEIGMKFLQGARLFALAALMATFLALPGLAQSVASLPQPTDYVSDFAHVLSPEATARLDSICSQLDHSTAHAEIAVVTVNSLNGDDAADYADDLEDHWKMGNNRQNRYAMVLLAVNDHRYRIEVGYGLEGILTDGDVGDIGRAMVPYLKASDYDSAVMLGVGQVAQVIASNYHVTVNANLSQPLSQPAQPRSSGLEKFILLILFLSFFGGFSLLRMLLGWGLFFGGWGAGPWMGAGGLGGGGFGGGGGGGGDGFAGFGGVGGGFGGGGAGGEW